ncbi:MAG TPA: hypothetical protein VF844_03030, partial [Ktedonobacteraceae bacterium]
ALTGGHLAASTPKVEAAQAPDFPVTGSRCSSPGIMRRCGEGSWHGLQSCEGRWLLLQALAQFLYVLFQAGDPLKETRDRSLIALCVHGFPLTDGSNDQRVHYGASDITRISNNPDITFGDNCYASEYTFVKAAIGAWDNPSGSAHQKRANNGCYKQNNPSLV